MNVSLTVEPAVSASATGLLHAFSNELAERYDDAGTALRTLSPDDVAKDKSVFVVARSDGQAVGCGGLRLLGQDIAEVKGLYVDLAARRKGVGRQILADLERRARDFGYKAIWLETGRMQPEAVMLFIKSGYMSTEPYGHYLGDPLSVCFKKML